MSDSLISYLDIPVSTPSTSTSDVSLAKFQDWKEFEIPWEKLSASNRKKCEDSIKDKAVITAVVNMVVSEMREIRKDISSKVFKIIALKIIKKYPIFRDEDDNGKIFGDGAHTLFFKLLDRNNYLNRAPKAEYSLIHELPKRRRLSRNLQVGCTTWQPEQHNNDLETIEKQKILLKGLSPGDNSFYEYLENTYTLQRLDINKGIPIKKLLLEWPAIFLREGLLWHYKKLTGQESIQLIHNILEKKTRFMQKFSNIQPEHGDVYTTLKIISSHFKEKMADFIKFEQVIQIVIVKC